MEVCCYQKKSAGLWTGFLNEKGKLGLQRVELDQIGRAPVQNLPKIAVEGGKHGGSRGIGLARGGVFFKGVSSVKCTVIGKAVDGV